ncbi:alpha/beta hydrolase [Rhodococcus sp. NPDC058514]|uniref:alpha/beta hydrolase n=1 Tax=unclassified Rhodococcus (in: high G+C Gram-positive bacteria) TaxID=192944 RepID=UPI00364E8C4E
MDIERVEFRAEDGTGLVGVMRIPAGATRAVTFTGPFTGVKEQVVGTYAEGLARAGFATLAFDHRNHGESGGAIRRHEDAAGKLADLRAAVGYLGARGFGRIGLTGVCLGGGYALKAAAQDSRVAALACVAGAYPGAPGSFAQRGGAYREALRDIWDSAWTEDGLPVYQKAVTDDGGQAAMMGAEPFEYYGTKRSYSPHWENSVTVASGFRR